MIGLDTANSVFQIHGVNEAGKAEIKCKLRRSGLIPFFEKQSACTVVMEACGAGHHWGRMLTGLGDTVRLIAPETVKPFVKKGKKNDAADAAAICEAASRPEVKFVPVENTVQQGILALHTARSLLIRQKTMLGNAIRGLATEFGLTVSKGMENLDELVALVGADETIPTDARLGSLRCMTTATIWSKASKSLRQRSSRMRGMTRSPVGWPQSPASVQSPHR